MRGVLDCVSPPACAGESATGAGRAARPSAPTAAETGSPSASAECALRRDGPSSACAHSWPGSEPHPQSTPHAQPFQQIDKPLAVAASLNADQRRRSQRAIKPLRLAIPVHQLVFAYLPGLRIENRYLLPARMKITSYNLHRRLLPWLAVSGPQSKNHYTIVEAFVLIPSGSGSPQTGLRLWGEDPSHLGIRESTTPNHQALYQGTTLVVPKVINQNK